jgi:hypothetical protein
MTEQTFIDGIYNYCDGWCARCPKTANCRVFARQNDTSLQSDPSSVTNEDCRIQLRSTLQETISLLRAKAQEEGIALEDLETKEYPNGGVHIGDPKYKVPVQMAKTYMDGVGQWFEDTKASIHTYALELEQNAKLDLEGNHPEQDLEQLADHFEVIQWYLPLIYAKLQRAVPRERPGHSSLTPEYMYDTNGSAKVALVAIDRSLAAWLDVMGHLLEHEGPILGFLSELQRLSKTIEQTFPEAHAFIRPGFDN